MAEHRLDPRLPDVAIRNIDVLKGPITPKFIAEFSECSLRSIAGIFGRRRSLHRWRVWSGCSGHSIAAEGYGIRRLAAM
jgi:hypothetical protein